MNMFLRLVVVFLRSRLRGRTGALGPCRTPFRVRPTDLDPLGHVNNGVYFTLFDLGRVELILRSGLYRRFNQQGWYVVVTAETGSFRRELRPFRRFDLDTRILGWDERHLYFEHRVVSGGRTTTTAVVQVRFLARDGERIAPERVVDLLPDAPSRPELPDWVAEWGKRSYEHARSLEGSRSLEE